MNGENKRTTNAARPRHKAGDTARKEAVVPPEDLEAMSPAEIRNTLHSLRVHQIALETQNEELRRTRATLQQKTAILEAQLRSSIDGVLIVDENGKKVIQNQRCVDLWKIPPPIVDNHDDEQQVEFVKNRTTDPEAFVSKIVHLYSHPDECSHDEVELNDGTTLDRYSAPVVGDDGTHFGRIWTFRDITERKQAEAVLRQTEEQLHRMVLRTAMDGYMLLDRQGRLLEVNDTYCRMIGYSEEELLAMSAADVEAGESTDAIAAHMPKLVGQQGDRFESRHRRKNGDTIDVEVSAQYHPDGGGKVVVFIRDITERKQAEDAYRLDRERMETLLALNQMLHDPLDRISRSIVESSVRQTASQMGFCGFLDAEGETMRSQIWGEQAMDSCAVCAEDFPDNPLVFSLKDGGLWADAIRRREPVVVNDYTGPTPEKRGVPLGHVPLRRFLGVPVMDGKEPVAMIGVANKTAEYGAVDVLHLRLLAEGITHVLHRRRDEAALRKRETQLHATLEATADGILAVDSGGKVLHASRRFGELWGVPDSILECGDDDALLDFVLKQLANPDAFLEKVRLLYTSDAADMDTLTFKDGRLFERYSFPMILDGARIGRVWSFRDITEHKRMAERLRQSEKMSAIGQLAGGVAHEFNNKLLGIMSYVDLCRDKLPLGHPVRGYVDEIAKDAQSSADITRQLLAFARKQAIAPKRVDLNAALPDMLRMLRRLLGENIALTWSPGADLWSVKADPSQLDQILTNLCVNARDAIAGVGEIRIETANITLDESYCGKHPDATPGDYVRLAVSDNGHGIRPEVLVHIFEPFFTTKEVGRGTGLGLPTVYGIIAQNKGHIAVNSTLGVGTTFSVYLPRVASKPDAKQRAVPPAKLPRGTETILVAEDEKSVRLTAELFLKTLGYTVLAAESPEQAMRLAGAHSGPIHLLFTDVIMPGMNGRDLAVKLAAQRPDLKCLFMSGYTADIIMRQGSQDEDLQFIAKPFSRSDLACKVRDVLGADLPHASAARKG